MGMNIDQVFIANPITSNVGTDLIYVGEYPYAPGDDAAITYTNFSAQFVLSSAIVNGAHGGTGVNNGTSTITIGGNVTYSGAFTFAGTLTGNTAVTFPTSGTLATTAQVITVNNVITASAALTVQTRFIANDASSLVTLTLPTTAAIGDLIQIRGSSASGWIVAQNANQIIHVGSAASTAGATGSVASTNRYDCMDLTCIVANLEFVVNASHTSGFTIV